MVFSLCAPKVTQNVHFTWKILFIDRLAKPYFDEMNLDFSCGVFSVVTSLLKIHMNRVFHLEYLHSVTGLLMRGGSFPEDRDKVVGFLLGDAIERMCVWDLMAVTSDRLLCQTVPDVKKSLRGGFHNCCA